MIENIWQNFLTILREEVGSRVVDTWFKAVVLHRWDALEKVVYLQTPNTFVKEWLQKNYVSLVQVHLGRLLHVELPQVIFVSAQEKKKESHVSVIPASLLPSEKVKNTVPIKYSGYSPKHYSFDTFVVGSGNAFAHAAAQAVTKKPGKLYNPLFIYGGSGLGKTHLLHAIGNAIKAEHKNATVLYQTTNRFVNEFIHAIRFDKVHTFQKKYQNIDVLLIDDVQFISNKEQTQEAFFHIFNVLYDAHKQLVFSSDTYPQHINGVAERLRSRLGCGLVTDIHPPTLETKIAILKKKAESITEQVPDEAIHFIASQVTVNIRELEGILIRVMAFATLIKQPITLDLVRKVIYKNGIHDKNLTFDHIMKGMSMYYPHDIKSKSRQKDIVFARQVAIFLMRRLTDKSLRDIGDFLGGRDHTTVRHALEKMEVYIKQYPEFSIHLKKVEEDIYRLQL